VNHFYLCRYCFWDYKS